MKEALDKHGILLWGGVMKEENSTLISKGILATEIERSSISKR